MEEIDLFFSVLESLFQYGSEDTVEQQSPQPGGWEAGDGSVGKDHPAGPICLLSVSYNPQSFFVTSPNSATRWGKHTTDQAVEYCTYEHL